MAYLSLVFAALISSAHCIGYHNNRTGSSKSDQCSDLWQAASSERPENGGFVVKSTITSEWGGRYTPGQSYNLDLVGLVNPYEGFIIQARDRWNEGLILGSFIPLDTSKAQTIHCLGNDHGTVTHKSKNPVSVQSFIWQAPPTLEGSGEVDFVYLVMESFSSPQHWIKSISPSRDMKEKTTDHKMVTRHTHDPMMMDNMTENGTALDATDPERSILIRVHCVLMVLAFSIFGPIGIFFGSWMRPVMSQRGLWFQLHRAFMIAMVFLSLLGFICIFMAHRQAQFNNMYGLVPLDRKSDVAHFTLGFLVIILLIANPLISIFRCQPKDPNRWIYNLIHGVLVGFPFQIIVMVESCVGVYLVGGEGPMLWIFLTFVGFTILMNTGQGILTFLVLGRDADLPAPARLLLQFLKKTKHTSKHTSTPKEEVIELEKYNNASSAVIVQEKSNNASSDPLTPSKSDLLTPSKPDPPSSSLSPVRSTKELVLRWSGLSIYIAVSMPLLVAVIVLICLTSPD